MLYFRKWLEDFASHYSGVKNKWQTIEAKDVLEDPSIADELFHLIHSAYSKIGGHVDLRSPKDIIRSLVNGEMSFYKAIDADAEPDPDALIGYKNKSGKKAVVSAVKHNSELAKKAWFNYNVDSFKEKGHYSEVSDAMAGALLKPGTPVVEDEAIVRKVLQKEIKWYGAFPEFEAERLKERGVPERVINRFKEFKGWYGRALGDGEIHVKIMIGIPQPE
jgi:hypothetical protein